MFKTESTWTENQFLKDKNLGSQRSDSVGFGFISVGYVRFGLDVLGVFFSALALADMKPKTVIT